MIYQITNVASVLKGTTEDGVVVFIPNDPANRDWQAYQAWLSADVNNQPLAAE